MNQHNWNQLSESTKAALNKKQIQEAYAAGYRQALNEANWTRPGGWDWVWDEDGKYWRNVNTGEISTTDPGYSDGNGGSFIPNYIGPDQGGYGWMGEPLRDLGVRR